MKKYIFMCLATLLCLEACKENERQLFALNEDFLNIWFGGVELTSRTDSTVYNYYYRPLTLEYDSVMFHVRVAGMPSALDRTFELEAVEGDLGQVIAGEHYVVKPYVIPQGEVSGIFPIYLKSTDDFKNSSFKVVFAVREKDGFRGGAREYARLYLSVEDMEKKPFYWEEDLETYQPLNKFWGTYSAVKYRFMTQVIGVPVTRVCYGAVIPSAPGELTYSEAVYWQNRCRQELEAYNNDPANPDRPLSDEFGPISF